MLTNKETELDKTEIKTRNTEIAQENRFVKHNH